MDQSQGQRVIAWLGQSKLGLVVVALVVGGAAGLGAAGFRELIFLFTWIFTGHDQFGQQGHAASLHLPFAGFFFVLFVPVIGGLLYGPLIQRFAPEARGHGVPEVMLAVAENGGRIRPPVTIVKALASAICIGTGGSVGREGPIVQIGSALASSVGQLVRMTEARLRVIVACGAAGGIAATFNAPLTGLFFAFEIVLREFSLDALFATSLSAVTADLVSRALFGGAPFFSAIPHNLSVGNDATYLLMAILGLVAGLIGYGFKMFLYGMEDRVDELWGRRPEWLRPVVGGLALGLLLLALPQMYGVGYPVMDRVLGGHEVLWFVVILMLGKIAASSLTLSIGGSGGVFAPSLFTGAAAGEAFGIIVHHLFGPAVGPPAMYGVVAMGGVFAGAAQAPLTSIASVAEMTGNFTLTLPIMLVTGIASALSRRLTYGSIYTTKLLRRGIDIERPKATAALRSILVSDVMQPLSDLNGSGELTDPGEPNPGPTAAEVVQSLVGAARRSRQTQVLFDDEDLAQALRQLVLFGRDGLPVLSHDSQLRGWLTRNNVLSVLAEEIGATAASGPDGVSPDNPLVGYRLLEIEVRPGSPAADRRVQDVEWPRATVPVAVTQGGEIRAVRPDTILPTGERLMVLVPAALE
ncbi:MAG TPA: chloride channel protein [Solirubrobacteraceae bacterium]|nr:chloride channel protein [Solirubrobacteraceae bacterium]